MAQHPNIIFLLCDQMQQKAVMDPASGCLMPHLRTLGQDCVTFENAHTVNPICSPARASLITGLLPHNHGMVDCTHTVPAYRAQYDAALPNLPQTLRAADYRMAYYGKWHVERSYDLSQFGFEDYETEKQIPQTNLTPVKRVALHTESYRPQVIAGVYQEDSSFSEEHYVYNRAMSFVDQVQGNPFCVFISTYAPHDPYVIPEEIYDLYKDKEISLPCSAEDGMEDKPAIYRRLKALWKDMSHEDLVEIVRCYWGYCTLVDMQVGRLVAYLKEKKLYDDTIIVFLSDHGDMAGAHGLFCKGVPAFEEVYRIPLLMKLAGQERAGEIRSDFADTCDVLPTVLNLAGVPWQGRPVDGKNLFDPSQGHKTVGYAEFHGQRYSYTQRVVWEGAMKYVFNAFDEDELYDLSRDPDEIHNLAQDPKFEPIKKQLAARMWQRVLETNDWSLRDAQYFMHRFAPVGPQHTLSEEAFSMYNKTF